MSESPQEPHPEPNWQKIGVYLAALSMIATIVIALYQSCRDPFSQSNSATAPTTPKIVPPTIERSPPASPETKAPVPDFTPSAAPPLQAHEKRYRLDFADRTFVDLDSGLANTDGGPEYEVRLSYGRFFTGQSADTWRGTKIIFLKDSQISFNGCSRGTRIQESVAFLNRLAQDESVCISTNRGAWAAMKIANSKSREITFDVRLFTAGS